MHKFTKILKINDFYPIMGVKLTPENSILMDFTAKNKDLETLDLASTKKFNDYIFDQLVATDKDFGIGGYLEPRAIYHRSEVFGKPDEEPRSMHLGVDIWALTGQAVHAPLAGKVHSFQNNKGFGNYGPTIILQHELEGVTFFALYGHLTASDLEGLEVDQEIKAGQEFCHIGPFPENGDWPPHLHFQLIMNLDGNWGDYPGVCAPKDMEHYRSNCPDPRLIIGM